MKRESEWEVLCEVCETIMPYSETAKHLDKTGHRVYKKDRKKSKNLIHKRWLRGKRP